LDIGFKKNAALWKYATEFMKLGAKDNLAYCKISSDNSELLKVLKLEKVEDYIICNEFATNIMPAFFEGKIDVMMILMTFCLCFNPF